MDDPARQPLDHDVEEYAGDQAQDDAPDQDEVRERRSRYPLRATWRPQR